jgi:hypothetical protein
MSDARDDELKSWLRRLVGKKVADINFSVYVAATNALYPVPFQIEIVCEAGERGMIVLSPEGERVEYSDSDIMIADVGEFGRVERRKIAPRFDPLGIVDSKIENVELVMYGGHALGGELEFSSGRKLIVVNNGDEMLLLSGRNHPALQQDNLQYERIC